MSRLRHITPRATLFTRQSPSITFLTYLNTSYRIKDASIYVVEAPHRITFLTRRIMSRLRRILPRRATSSERRVVSRVRRM